MFLTTNYEVIWILNWTGHGMIIHVSVIVKLASSRVNEPSAQQSRACDSRNYRRVIVEITARRPMEVLHKKFMWGIIIYKYNILERVLVENIIPRNVIINRGAAEVDNHISRDDFFRLAPSQECYIYFIIPNSIPLFSNHGERSFKNSAMCKKVRMIEIISFTKGLCLYTVWVLKLVMIVNKSYLIITDDFKLLSLQRRGNQHCRLNGVAVDDAVLLQNRKFRLICSILVLKCSACSN